MFLLYPWKNEKFNQNVIYSTITLITPLFGIVHFKTNYNYRLSNHCFINELILVTYALISNAVENRKICAHTYTITYTCVKYPLTVVLCSRHCWRSPSFTFDYYFKFERCTKEPRQSHIYNLSCLSREDSNHPDQSIACPCEGSLGPWLSIERLARTGKIARLHRMI